MGGDKKPLPVKALLEWAFGVEFAQLQLPEREDPEARGFGMEWLMIQRGGLGTQIDTSPGQSAPHDDADAVASIVSALPVPVALQVAGLARRCETPDWMPGQTPRIAPVGWRQTPHGRTGQTETIRVYYEAVTRPHPKNPARTVTTRRKVVVDWVPCQWTPAPQEIAAARTRYSDWWLALDVIRGKLQGISLRHHRISDQMPERRPWDRG